MSKWHLLENILGIYKAGIKVILWELKLSCGIDFPVSSFHKEIENQFIKQRRKINLS